MSSQIVKEDIVRLLETIIEQNIIIHAYEKNIPQIELDLLMENIRKLYSRFHELNKINSAESIPTPALIDRKAPEKHIAQSEEIEKQQPEKTPEVVIEQKHQAAPEAVTAETPAKSEEEPAALPKEEKISEDAGPKAEESTPVETKTEKKPETMPATDLFGLAATLADKYKDDKKYLNDSMGDNSGDKSVAAKMQKNKISNLKAAIGINEKFLFINELFKGDMQDYTETIQKLNEMPNRDEASNLLNQLIEKYQWNNDNEAFVRFMNLFNRRF